jgi:serine/threonine-protein kinase RsbW
MIQIMPSSHSLELPNDLRTIDRAVQYLMDRSSEAGFDPDRLRLNFRVSLTEALANAMLYGNCRDPRKKVLVQADIDAACVRVQVTDEGRGFNPASLPDPTSPDNRRRTGGRGIFLIRKLMDSVEFNDRGNSITMILLNSETRKAAGG